jgi:primosomal replication protein N
VDCVVGSVSAISTLNEAIFSGKLLQLSALRYTPSGMAVCTLELEHASQIIQAGNPRALLFTVEATALGEAALAVAPLQLGETYTFTGFWAPAHYRSKRIGFNVLSLS